MLILVLRWVLWRSAGIGFVSEDDKDMTQNQTSKGKCKQRTEMGEELGSGSAGN